MAKAPPQIGVRILRPGQTSEGEYLWRPQPGQQTELMYNYIRESLIGGEKYSGKAQPLTSNVLTPEGFRPIGKVQVGDQICNPDGSVAKVIGVYPQGKQKIWRFKFSDGAEARATGDHLWAYETTSAKLKADRRYYPFSEVERTPLRVATTDQVKKIVDTFAARPDRLSKKSIHIPCPEPVAIGQDGIRGSKRTIDPYVLGVLIGDGSLTGDDVCFTSADADVINIMQAKFSEGICFKQQTTKYGYRIRRSSNLIHALTDLGLWGHRSESKFVPECYKQAPIETRLDVLRGLLDTDGTVSTSGRVSFCSVSKQLADDVQWLVRSLGGLAYMTSKIPSFTYKGEKKKGQRAYNVNIRTKMDADLFRMERKKTRCKGRERSTDWRISRAILSIVEDGEEEAVCIAVDHPNRMYITDDFVVTHNTYASIGWMVRGNKWKDPNDPNLTPTDVLYTNNRNFRGAVIRKNVEDLDDWVEKARPFYEALGATLTTSPYTFTWQNGAKIKCYHMADKDSYQRITGKSTTRLFWDEVTFEKDADVYAKVFSSVRSSDKQMIAQVLCAANPEGPGVRWVKERFMKAKDKDGKTPTRGVPFEVAVWDPIQKKTTYIQRVFLPWVVSQNKIGLDNDPTYIASLASIENEALRRAYLYGDWEATGGQVFSKFRPNGPLEDEPETAHHVFEDGSIDIKPWWPMYVGMDWGYQHAAAAFKFTIMPNGRLLVLDEKILAKLGSEVWGAEIARWCEPELINMARIGVQPSINLFLSPDAVGKRDDVHTQAQGIQNGINKILGKDAAHLIAPRDDKDTEDLDFFKLREIQTKAKIVIRRAFDRRIIGVNYIHDLLRFDVVAEKDYAQYDQAYADKLVQTEGTSKYFEYLDSFKNKEQPVPLMMISSRCKRLIGTIPSLSADPNNIEDVLKTKTVEDDIYDGWRYGCMGHRIYKESDLMPEALKLEEKMKHLPKEFAMNQRNYPQQAEKVIHGFRVGRGANRGIRVM